MGAVYGVAMLPSRATPANPAADRAMIGSWGDLIRAQNKARFKP